MSLLNKVLVIGFAALLSAPVAMAADELAVSADQNATVAASTPEKADAAAPAKKANKKAKKRHHNKANKKQHAAAQPAEVAPTAATPANS